MYQVRVFPKGSTELVSEHFRAMEFDCKNCDCKFTFLSNNTVGMLETIREHFKRKYGDKVYIRITSGYRCIRKNTKIDGAPKSTHRIGIAVDIKVYKERGKTVTPKEVHDFIDKNLINGGLKKYSTWVHLDTRLKKWRG